MTRIALVRIVCKIKIKSSSSSFWLIRGKGEVGGEDGEVSSPVNSGVPFQIIEIWGLCWLVWDDEAGNIVFTYLA